MVSVLDFFKDILGTDPVEIEDTSEWAAVPITSCPVATDLIVAASRLLPYVRTCDQPELALAVIRSATIAVDFDVWNRGELPE
jgi:hypothetical protein